MEQPQLKKTLGIPEATFALTGFVIGMGPFIIPGELAPDTGPALFISFLIAGVLGALSCVIAARVGGLFPISGAGYIGASCVLSPAYGFLLVWMIMMTMVLGMPILGFGFADYLAYFIPDIPKAPVAAGAIIVFGLLNLIGVRATVAIQAVLVSVLLLILVVFDIGGIAHRNPELMTPLAPNGFGPVFVAAIPAYFGFSGLMIIVEMGDEIKNPARTIPVTLALTLFIVLAIFLATSVALTGLIPWNTIKGMPAPLVEASEVFLPAWCAKFIAGSALLGAAVNINAWFMMQTRDIYALARDRILPAGLARVNARTGEPYAAVIFATAIASSGVLLGASVKEYIIMVVIAMAAIQVLSGLAVMLAPWRIPDRCAKSSIKLGRFGSVFFGGAFALFSATLILGSAKESPRSLGVFMILLAIGSLYYWLRRRFLQKSGISIEDVLKKDLARLD